LKIKENSLKKREKENTESLKLGKNLHTNFPYQKISFKNLSREMLKAEFIIIRNEFKDFKGLFVI